MAPSSQHRSGSTGICLALVALTAAAYAPALRNDFINLDDPDYVTDNFHVFQGLSWRGIRWAFGSFDASNWHPLTWLSHMLDCNLYGTRAWGHHLTNLFLHVANTLILFLGVKGLTGAPWRSWVVAALFALHPMHVESVAWVSERKDLLSTFFGLLSLVAFATYAKRTTAATALGKGVPKQAFYHYAMALGLFALSLMSKPMLMTLPMLMVCLDYWPLGRLRNLPGSATREPRGPARSQVLMLLVEKLPFLLLAISSGVVALLAQQHGGSVASIEAVPVSARLWSALVAYALYVGKLFVPWDLAVLYPLRTVWPVWSRVAALVLLVGISADAWWMRRRRPYVAVGWIWFVIGLAPVIGLVQVGVQAMADRYSYLPYVGLMIPVVWGTSDFLAARLPREAGRVGWITAVTVLATCFTLTWKQLGWWKNSETLFTRAIAVTEANYLAHNNLGAAYLDAGRLDTAEAQFSAALAIRPNHIPALFGLAAVCERRQRFAEGIALLQRAVRLKPNDPWARLHLGAVLGESGNPAQAIDCYQEALRLDPEFPPALINLADLLIRTGKPDEGLDAARRALRLAPDSSKAHFQAGNALFLKEQFQDAMAHYQSSLRSDPGFGAARLNLAKLWLRRGEQQQAEQEFKILLKTQPDDAEAHRLLAALYSAQGRWNDAASEYSELSRLFPNSPEILNNLAWLLATAPDGAVRNGARAVDLAGRACELTSQTNASLLATLAAALAESGKFDEAARVQEKALTLVVVPGEQGAGASFRQRLDLYRNRQAYREPGPSAKR